MWYAACSCSSYLSVHSRVLECALLQGNQCRQLASFHFIGSLRHSSTAEIKPRALRSAFLFHVLGKGSSYEGCMDRCVTGLKKERFSRTTQCLFYFYIVWLAFNSQSNRFFFRYSKKGARFTKSHSNPTSPSHAPLFWYKHCLSLQSIMDKRFLLCHSLKCIFQLVHKIFKTNSVILYT